MRKIRITKKTVRFTVGVAAISLVTCIFTGIGFSKSLKINKELKIELKLQQKLVEGLKENIKEDSEKERLLQKEATSLNETFEKQSKTDNTVLNRTQTRVAYLTFDDGPSENTSVILDFLKANNVKGTFFVGSNGEESIYKRIIEEGHTLAPYINSTQYEDIYTNSAVFMKELNSISSSLERITGMKPSITRIPGGSVNSISKKYGGENILNEIRQAVTEAGLTYFDWNVDSKDNIESNQSQEDIVKNVLEGSSILDEAVILLHDTNKTEATLEALPEIIDGLRKEGFIFRAITPETPPLQYK